MYVNEQILTEYDVMMQEEYALIESYGDYYDEPPRYSDYGNYAYYGYYDHYANDFDYEDPIIWDFGLTQG